MALVADYGLSSDDDDEEISRADVNGSVETVALAAPARSEEVLEDFVKKTNYDGVVLERPPPKPKMSEALVKMRLPAAKGRVQISIPSIQDSDSEEEEPVVKKPRTAGGASGFLGSLPPPRASAGGKDSGRAFIPYTLTKHKPAAPAKPTVAKTKHTKQHTNTAQRATKLTGSYSDSDDDMHPQPSDSGSANFFSLTTEPSSSGFARGVDATPSIVAPSSDSAVEIPQPMVTAASLYNMTEDTGGMEDAYDNNSYANTEQKSSSLVDDLMQDEQFLRLQGKKQRGRETIELIDIHTDDQKVSELELSRNLTEEVDPAAFAHRKKGDGPSSQQKRKHQITYLAFQAKEKELELKNTWAANRATKQQTQAKYGF